MAKDAVEQLAKQFHCFAGAKPTTLHASAGYAGLTGEETSVSLLTTDLLICFCWEYYKFYKLKYKGSKDLIRKKQWNHLKKID